MVSFPYLLLFQVDKLQAKQSHILAKQSVTRTDAALKKAQQEYQQAVEEGREEVLDELLQVYRASELIGF